MKLCECNCGREVNNRFVSGHNRKGIISEKKGKTLKEMYGKEKAEKLRKQNSDAHKGKHSKTEFKKGHVSWNDNTAKKIKCFYCQKETTNKKFCCKQCHINYNYKYNIQSKSCFEKEHIPWNKHLRGVMPIPWNKQEKVEIICKQCKKIFFVINSRINAKCCSKKCLNQFQKTFIREKSNNWRNGASFKPYGYKFNNVLKEQIRERDSRVCQICDKTEEVNGRKLDIHHINYNKQNNNKDNLISLCHICHMKTNGNRHYWINLFRKIQ